MATFPSTTLLGPLTENVAGIVAAIDVSLIRTDVELPPAETTKFSEPSVKESFSKKTDIVASPLELTKAVPLSTLPETSAALTPDMV